MENKGKLILAIYIFEVVIVYDLRKESVAKLGLFTGQTFCIALTFFILVIKLQTKLIERKYEQVSNKKVDSCKELWEPCVIMPQNSEQDDNYAISKYFVLFSY